MVEADIHDSAINIAHDHYKETFAYIREREAIRNRLFFFVIGSITLLGILIRYPENIVEALSAAEIQGLTLNLSTFPIHVLISSNWMVLAVIILRYYQCMVDIERQYDYLHLLEDKIKLYFRRNEIDIPYRREGQHYLNNRAVFANWVWFFYTIIVPIAVCSAMLSIFIFSWQLHNIRWYHLAFDGLMMLAALGSVLLYTYTNHFGKEQTTNSDRRYE